jgi:hypothetical protein
MRLKGATVPKCLLLAASLTVALAGSLAGGDASAAKIKLLSANRARLIVVDLVREFERQSDNKVAISQGEAGDLRSASRMASRSTP